MNTPTTAHVWHALFKEAQPKTLLDALDCGLVDSQCLDDEGRDLLFSFLSRDPREGVSASSWMSPVSFLRGADSEGMLHWEDLERTPQNPQGRWIFQQVCRRLLQRPDVNPFTRWPLESQGVVSSFDLAMAGNMVGLLEGMMAHPSAPSKEDWLQLELEGNEATRPRLSSAPFPWLHMAVSLSRLDLVDFLLDQGVDINQRDAAGKTAFFHATNVKTVEVLLERGGDPMLSAGRQSLMDYWMEQRKGDYAATIFDEMRSAVSRYSSKAIDESAIPMATAWLGQACGNVSPYDISPSALSRVKADWASGWENFVEPCLKLAPMHSWRRKGSSGWLTGTLSPLAELGMVFLKNPLSNHLSLMDNYADLFGPDVVTVRKGVTDRGLLAMGVFHVLAALKKQDTHYLPEVNLMRTKNIHRALSSMEALAPWESWCSWMMETMETLQRPKNHSLRETVSSVIHNYLSLQKIEWPADYPEGFRKFMKQCAGPGQANAPRFVKAPVFSLGRLEEIQAFTSRGIRLGSSKLWSMVASFSWNKKNPEEEALWLTQSLIVLADQYEQIQLTKEGRYVDARVKNLTPSVSVLREPLERVLRSPVSKEMRADPRIEVAIESLSELPELFPGLRESWRNACLAAALPATDASPSQAGKRPRL